jgi:hypothetical protein
MLVEAALCACLRVESEQTLSFFKKNVLANSSRARLC